MSDARALGAIFQFHCRTPAASSHPRATSSSFFYFFFHFPAALLVCPLLFALPEVVGTSSRLFFAYIFSALFSREIQLPRFSSQVFPRFSTKIFRLVESGVRCNESISNLESSVAIYYLKYARRVESKIVGDTTFRCVTFFCNLQSLRPS